MLARATFAALVAASAAAVKSTLPAQDWGYVDVRTGAHMFWWLHAANVTGVDPTTVPLVMWLQGGPGASSIAYGSYGEMGPIDTNLNYRNNTWLTAANLLFVENPVGAGWSYVDDLSLLPTNNSQIADDLVTLFTAFLSAYPVFETVPFFVFCESYGGKMTTTFSTALLAAIDAGKLKSNFRGVALGDSWISAIDFTDTWGTVLRTTALMEANELAIMNANAVVPCQQAVAAGDWTTATNLWGTTENYVSQFSCVDFYNILQVDCSAYSAEAFAAASPFGRMSPAALALAPEGIDHDILQSLYARHVARHLTYDQNTLMNVYIRQQLNAIRPNTFPANVTWGAQSDAVFSTLSGDFMRPVVDEIDALLAGGRINVTIYEGNVDLICANVGAEQWMQKLTWSGMPSFWASNKTALSAFPGAPTGAFTKNFGTLSWWTVLQAGHMVPTDNGPMALAMLKNILAAQA